ncbi:MAG: dihydrofolate reductase [Butyrivibrio sp.]|nr:dihydrofolate reductase [Butyrivibrio sp.]
MNLIAAVDKNWGIGYKNGLLVRIPEDQKWFRETTTGKAVIMGRKTFESFPGKRPLKDRLNIVITRDLSYTADGAVVVHGIDEAVAAASRYREDDIYVIGGEAIYRQMLPLCGTAHITKIDYAYQADAYFPNLDESKDWQITQTSGERTYFDIIFEYVKYERK